IFKFQGIASIKQIYFDDLSFDLKTLLENRMHSDVTFTIGGTEVKAHKAILSARSPVFAAKFEQPNATETEEGKVTVKGVQAGAFVEFLSYLYTGYLPERKPISDNLLILADKVVNLSIFF